MERAVIEVLDSLLSEPLADRVLESALILAGELKVPEVPARTLRFVRGPLRHAADHFAGRRLGDAIVECLEPVLELAADHVALESREPLASTVRPDLLEGTPQVVIASGNRTMIRALIRRLPSKAEVHCIGDVLDLMDLLEVLREPVILIDCAAPIVDAPTLATLRPMLTEGARVILLSASDPVRAAAEAVTRKARDWISCDPEATPTDVAQLVRGLWSDRSDRRSSRGAR
jgi:hypothetical protein